MAAEGTLLLTVLCIGFVLGIMFSVFVFGYFFTGRSGAKARKWLSNFE
jgi:hypothetical protein